jgi:hypothetical protein
MEARQIFFNIFKFHLMKRKKFFAIATQMDMICKRSISEYWTTDYYLVTPVFHSSQSILFHPLLGMV